MISETTRPDWHQLFSEGPRSKCGSIRFLDDFVKNKSLESEVGFYIYSEKGDYDIKSYKIGQTTKGIYERIKAQRGSGITGKFLIFDWFPSNLANIEKYDQKILKNLQDQGKCIIRKTLDKDIDAIEWAIFHDDNPREIIRDYLNGIENGLNRSHLELTIWQIETLDKLISMLNAGNANKKLVAVLAARFGKTLTYLALFYYLKKRVMVVGTYYLTALNSFKNEVVRYKEFENFEVLDLANHNFQELYNSLVNQGKQILIIASLCGDKVNDNTVRNQNAEFVSQITDKITVIDEADYGAHTENCVPFVDKLGENSSIILTTGTNSERAAKNHKKIDGVVDVTYLDMQMRALSDKIVIENEFIRKCRRALKFERNLVPVYFLRSDWSRYVSFLFDNALELNASFTKSSQDIFKAASFWKGLYRGLLGISSHIDLNCHSIQNWTKGNSESVIQFVSVKSNKQLKDLVKIASPILKEEYDVYSICGDDIVGKEAEKFVKEKIAIANYNGKKVWIIADRMCQRSFSVPEINTVILCYDNGDLGAMIQKISRALTVGDDKKIGYVISLSIDGNRDDKFSSIIMNAAEKVSEKEGISIPESIRKVLKTNPIFSMDENGDPIKLLPDEYAKELFSRSNGIRLAINRDAICVDKLQKELIDMLSNMDICSPSMKQIVDMVKGKTYVPTEKESEGFAKMGKEEKDKLIAFILKNLVNILDNISSMLKYQRMIHHSITLPKLISILNTEKDSSDMVGIDGNQLSQLINSGVLSKGVIETYTEMYK
jgi:hypothetical protein